MTFEKLKKLKRVTGPFHVPSGLMLSAKKVMRTDVEAVNACIDLYNILVRKGTLEMMPTMHEELRALCVRMANILEVGPLEDAK